MNENLVTRRESPVPFLSFPFFEKFNTLALLDSLARRFYARSLEDGFQRNKSLEKKRIFSNPTHIFLLPSSFFERNTFNIAIQFLFIFPDNVRIKNSLSLDIRITRSRFAAQEIQRCETRETLVTLLSHVAKLPKWQVLAFVEGRIVASVRG